LIQVQSSVTSETDFKIIFPLSSLMASFLENLKPHNRLLTSIELRHLASQDSLIHDNYDQILSKIQL